MRTFAKLFETERFGQILARYSTSDEGDPAITIEILAREPLDICGISVIFTSDDARTVFENRDIFMNWLQEKQALEYAAVIMDHALKLDVTSDRPDDPN